jgi:hypothetical protein
MDTSSHCACLSAALRGLESHRGSPHDALSKAEGRSPVDELPSMNVKPIE